MNTNLHVLHLRHGLILHGNGLVLYGHGLRRYVVARAVDHLSRLHLLHLTCRQRWQSLLAGEQLGRTGDGRCWHLLWNQLASHRRDRHQTVYRSGPHPLGQSIMTHSQLDLVQEIMPNRRIIGWLQPLQPLSTTSNTGRNFLVRLSFNRPVHQRGHCAICAKCAQCCQGCATVMSAT